MHKFANYLTKLIKEVMLDEISIRQLKNDNPKYIEQIEDAIRYELPNKYFQWYVNKIKENPNIDVHDSSYVVNLAKEFDKYLKTKVLDYVIKNYEFSNDYKNIEYWQNQPYDNFERFVKLARKENEYVVDKKEQQKREKQGGTKKIYDDGNIAIFEVLSRESTCLYGVGAKWCISMKDSDEYYKRYRSQNLRFIFIMNPKAEFIDYEKIALIFRRGEINQIRDAKNSHISSEKLKEIVGDKIYTLLTRYMEEY